MHGTNRTSIALSSSHNLRPPPTSPSSRGARPAGPSSSRTASSSPNGSSPPTSGRRSSAASSGISTCEFFYLFRRHVVMTWNDVDLMEKRSATLLASFSGRPKSAKKSVRGFLKGLMRPCFSSASGVICVLWKMTHVARIFRTSSLHACFPTGTLTILPAHPTKTRTGMASPRFAVARTSTCMPTRLSCGASRRISSSSASSQLPLSVNEPQKSLPSLSPSIVESMISSCRG